MNKQYGNFLKGNEIVGCPCGVCSGIDEMLLTNLDYPCEHLLRSYFFPELSSIRHTLDSDLLAEGYENGNHFIAYSSQRGIICFIQNDDKWEFRCMNNFFDFKEDRFEISPIHPPIYIFHTPAMCLHDLKCELMEISVPTQLLDTINVWYLHALREELASLENGGL